MSRTETDGTRTALASQFAGIRFNSPNDLVLAPDGQVALVAPDLGRPNGITLNRDATTLYVANDGHGGIRAYPIRTDGSLGAGTDFAPMPGIVDGLTLDTKGNLYAAGGLRTPDSQGIWIFSPTGDLLGTIPTPEMPTNCTFAAHTLYITAGTSLHAIDLLIPGAQTAIQDSSWGEVKTSR